MSRVASCPVPPPHCTAPRPRIFWYPSPLPPWQREVNWRWRFLPSAVRESKHHTTDGDCADYFVISNSEGASTAKTIRMFELLGARWPWWNRTIEYNVTRHIMQTPCDHGPGDCFYDRRWTSKHGDPSLPDRLRPSSPRRLVSFLTPTGAGGAYNYFIRGLDIRLPQDDDHECGPFCGVRKPVRRTRGEHVLRRWSLWAETDEAARERALLRRRPIQFFWAGFSAGSKGFRGGLLRRHLNRSGFLLHDTSPSGRKKSRSTADQYLELIGAPGSDARPNDEWFARAMSASTFCYSPLGQRHGDSDRYLPAILYGCVPVFIKENETGPLDELIDWSSVSLGLQPRDVPRIDEVLATVSHEHVVAMRRAMSQVWERLLWTQARRKPYLGESGARDAFASLMEMLRGRLVRECGGPIT